MNEIAVFRTEDVPATDRFGVWCERMSHLMAPMKMTSEHAADFRGRARVLQLGATQVWPTTLQSMHFRRTPQLARDSAPELYHLSLVLDGRFDIHQGGEQSTHGRHDLYIVNLPRPLDCRLTGAPGLTAIGVGIPKSLLPLPGRKVEQLLARRLPGRDGIGALVFGLVTQLSTDTAGYRSADGARLGTVLIDLVSALLAHTLEAERAVPPETQRRALLLRIRAFVQQHLHDPELSTASIAAAHHISVSYLHRLFRSQDITIAAWIRQQHLERIRRDLADPALLDTPIHEIAGRRGFTDAAVFSRTFRSAYGMSPRDFRGGHARTTTRR